VTDRLFIFRWDVDHRVCITDGLPRIRSVCRDFGVPNTFFVNMGRSTNLREWLGKGVVRSKAKLADKDAVHLIRKTGWPRFVLETALARPVGLRFVPVLHALQEARAQVIEIGDLHVDTATRVVTRGGRQVELTAREFDVLEVLARSPGVPVSRDHLLDTVWLQGFQGSPNVVDVYIGYLRKKLERPRGRRLIRTVRGKGFLLESP
jgi:DNA-binding response OmpR family regulator